MSRLAAALSTHLGSRQVARVIYGAIIGLALVVALEQHPPTPGVVAATLAATAVAVGLAELYSDMVAGRERFTNSLGEAGAVTFGAAFPAVFFVLAALDVMEPQTAFDVAAWSGVGLIAFYGFAAARLAGSTPLAALMKALAVAVIGVALIAFKAILH